MKIRLFAFGMLLAMVSLVGMSVAIPSQAHAASGKHTGSITATGVSGTYSTTSGTTSFTDGVVKVTHLAYDAATGQLLASGTVSSSSAGFSAPFRNDPVADPASCPILNLTLGPLNLNLLGLVVSIPNPIVVNVTAVPGPGNLLGNLLCAVANLLNNNGGLAGLTNLLSQINAILTGLGL